MHLGNAVADLNDVSDLVLLELVGIGLDLVLLMTLLMSSIFRFTVSPTFILYDCFAQGSTQTVELAADAAVELLAAVAQGHAAEQRGLHLRRQQDGLPGDGLEPGRQGRCADAASRRERRGGADCAPRHQQAR